MVRSSTRREAAGTAEGLSRTAHDGHRQQGERHDPGPAAEEPGALGGGVPRRLQQLRQQAAALAASMEGVCERMLRQRHLAAPRLQAQCARIDNVSYTAPRTHLLPTMRSARMMSQTTTLPRLLTTCEVEAATFREPC